MMTSLMHDRTDIILLLILPIIKDLPNPHSHIFLKQHPPPPSRLPHTFPLSANLPLVILAPPTHEESTIPLEPSPHIIRMIDPPIRFPFLNGLPA